MDDTKHWVEYRHDELERKQVNEMDYMNSVSKRLNDFYTEWAGK